MKAVILTASLLLAAGAQFATAETAPAAKTDGGSLSSGVKDTTPAAKNKEEIPAPDKSTMSADKDIKSAVPEGTSDPSAGKK